MDASERELLLKALDFGKVDAESETDLDRRFVRTADFEQFLQPGFQLILGAKGTGKSAIFDLFARFEGAARAQSSGQIDDVIIVTGTGLSDLHEVATEDLRAIQPGDQYDQLWRLYMAIKAAFAVADLAAKAADGPVAALMRAAGQIPDLRLGPLLKRLWNTVVSGDTPGKIGVGALSLGEFSKARIDATQILDDANRLLRAADRRLWILFDKVDELYPGRPADRKQALEGLLAETMAVRRTFDRIEPRVFLRTDLWRDLNFTNKTHLVDRRVTLSWSKSQLARLLVKGALTNADVTAYAARSVNLAGIGVDDLNDAQIVRILETILPEKVYPGDKEAGILDWMFARIVDASGTAFPREAVLLGTRGRAQQLVLKTPTSDSDSSLIGREAIREAFAEVSSLRCETYLAEFPELRAHFARFAGRTRSDFSRGDLEEMMSGLAPSGQDLLASLVDVGILRPVDGPVATATQFEIPRLYRHGLGLVIRGRA